MLRDIITLGVQLALQVHVWSTSQDYTQDNSSRKQCSSMHQLVRFNCYQSLTERKEVTCHQLFHQVF